MSRSPHVICAACIVARAANVVRPIPNLHRNRTRVTSIIGTAAVIRSATGICSTTIVRSVPWVAAIISFAPYCTEHRENQNQQKSQACQLSFCHGLCTRCFFVRGISNRRFHTLIIRITSRFHAPVCRGTASALGKKGVRFKQLHHALIEHGIRDLYESRDVRTNDEIARLAVFVGGFPRRLENRGHDMAQPRINLFAWPRQAH